MFVPVYYGAEGGGCVRKRIHFQGLMMACNRGVQIIPMSGFLKFVCVRASGSSVAQEQWKLWNHQTVPDSMASGNR